MNPIEKRKTIITNAVMEWASCIEWASRSPYQDLSLSKNHKIPRAVKIITTGRVPIANNASGAVTDKNPGISITKNQTNIKVCVVEKWPCFLFNQCINSFMKPTTKNTPIGHGSTGESEKLNIPKVFITLEADICIDEKISSACCQEYIPIGRATTKAVNKRVTKP